MNRKQWTRQADRQTETFIKIYSRAGCKQPLRDSEVFIVISLATSDLCQTLKFLTKLNETLSTVWKITHNEWSQLGSLFPSHMRKFTPLRPTSKLSTSALLFPSYIPWCICIYIEIISGQSNDINRKYNSSTGLLDGRSMVARPSSARPLARWPQWCRGGLHDKRKTALNLQSNEKLSWLMQMFG